MLLFMACSCGDIVFFSSQSRPFLNTVVLKLQDTDAIAKWQKLKLAPSGRSLSINFLAGWLSPTRTSIMWISSNGSVLFARLDAFLWLSCHLCKAKDLILLLFL
jgi:hypothetical protein